ncbi:hypothetical protein GMMP13_10021 [Candidatus Magnetomoraceae bacterium gMMP-13]
MLVKPIPIEINIMAIIPGIKIFKLMANIKIKAAPGQGIKPVARAIINKFLKLFSWLSSLSSLIFLNFPAFSSYTLCPNKKRPIIIKKP